MNITALQIQPYALPFVEELQTARGSHGYRYGWLVRVESEDGHFGWGDAAPWPGFASSFEEVAADLNRLCQTLPNLRLRLPRTLEEVRLLGKRASTKEAQHGLELALLDALGKQRGQRLAELLHGPHQERVATQQLVLSDGPQPTATTYKLKVGAGAVDEDVAHVRRLRKQLGDAVRLRLDAGGGWSVDESMAALKALRDCNIELIEQPLPTGQPAAWAEVHAVASACGIALAADESACCADFEALLAQGSIDAVILKPMFLGGLLAAMDHAKQARTHGLRVIITHALESAVGRCGALQLAAGFPGVHGLGTALAQDFHGLSPDQGSLQLPSRAGLGLELPSRPTPSEQPIAASEHQRALPLPLETSAIAHPGRLALSFDGESLRYCELRDAVVRTATELRANGVRALDCVGLEGPINLRWVVLFHALGWLGATVAPIDPAATEAERILWEERVAPAHIVHSDRPWPNAEADSDLAAERFWPLHEARLLLCTSGSSGQPKRITIDTLQAMSGAFGSAMRLGHVPGDAWLCCLPLHHIGGVSILFRAIFAGASVHLEASFNAQRCNEKIDSGAIQLVSLVPTMLQQLLDARKNRPFPVTLRAILLGGAAAPPELLQAAQQMGAPVALTYGMSETAAQVATNEPGDLDAGALAPLLGVRIEVDDSAGRQMLPQGANRLAVRGLQTHGRVRTGDLGEVVQGRVRVSGRADRIIISGGKNIHPDEVARILRQHPDVSDAAVVGLPCTRWGQRPHAVLVGQGTRPNDDELRAFLRTRLSGYKLPDSFLWLGELPRSPLGKLRYGRIATLVEQAIGNDAGIQNAELDPLPEPVRRSGCGFEGVQVNESVNQSSGGTKRAAAATEDAVVEGRRTFTDTGDLRNDVKAVVQTHRRHKVGLGVDQGHTDPLALDHGLDAAVARGQQSLLVSRMAKLKDPPEEQYAGSVHLKEPNGSVMYERHDDER